MFLVLYFIIIYEPLIVLLQLLQVRYMVTVGDGVVDVLYCVRCIPERLGGIPHVYYSFVVSYRPCDLSSIYRAGKFLQKQQLVSNAVNLTISHPSKMIPSVRDLSSSTYLCAAFSPFRP